MKTPRLPPSSTLDPAEWDFSESKVPDDELVACCYWEYARESSTIRDLFQAHRRPYPSPPESSGDLQAEASYRKMEKEFCEEMEPFFSLRWKIKTHSMPLWIAHKEFRDTTLKPWQLQPDEKRRKVADEMKGRRAAPSAFREVDCFRDLDLFKQPGWEIFRDAAKRASCIELNKERGWQRLLVEIDWEHFTNKEIVKSFAEWLEPNRPLGVSQKKGPAGWRTKLDRLGVMRLLYYFTLNKMPDNCQKVLGHTKTFEEAHGRPKTKTDPPWKTLDWPRHRQDARENFQQFLPFLPTNEQPIHYSRTGRGH